MIPWIALIPVFEPEARLLELIEDLKKNNFAAIVVVDDGSGEAYAEVFRKAGEAACVLTHKENRGKGSALKTGLAYIKGQFFGEYVVVTLDADGQHRAADARRVCEEAQNHPEALVLGSREIKKSAPLRSRFGNAITRGVYRLSTGVSVYDTQTGLRAFSDRRLQELLEVPGERYEYEMNVLLTCARMGTPIREMQIATIYLNDNVGSHFNPVKDSARVYREIAKFSASSLLSFFLDYTLYSALLFLTGGFGSAVSIAVSNITARLVSASVNYTLNRRLVFKNQGNPVKSALRYAGLAAVILFGNTLLLSLLADGLHMNRYAAKLITEVAFFVTSWLAQKFFVFEKSERIREIQG